MKWGCGIKQPSIINKLHSQYQEKVIPFHGQFGLTGHLQTGGNLHLIHGKCQF